MITHIIFLASGNSRRFGSNKLLADVAGKPLYRHGLDTLQKVVKAEKNCTLRLVSQYPQIRQEVEKLGIHTIDSPKSSLGMSHTIKAAIHGLGNISKDDFLLFVVADQPFLEESSVQKLLAIAQPPTVTARLCFENQLGNPVLFSAALIPELLQLKGDRGGSAITKRHPCTLIQACSAKELMDIDTIEDLEQEESNCHSTLS